MTDEYEIGKRKKMTFLQAEGIVPLPTQMVAGELTKEFKNRVWTVFWMTFSGSLQYSTQSDTFSFKSDRLLGAIVREFVFRRHMRIDEFPLDNMKDEIAIVDYWKSSIFNSSSLEFLDFLQWIMRDTDFPENLRNEIVNIFKSFPGDYALIPDPPTLVPLKFVEEREIVIDSLDSYQLIRTKRI